MNDKILDFFEKENIEYYRCIPYSACRKVREDIIERESFSPKSVIIFLMPYYAGETENLSRYAAACDYHTYIKDVTGRLIDVLKNEYPKGNYKGYGDHSPIDERHAALIGGLGILGDNGLLINQKYGSYIFIAEVISDIEPEHLGADELYEAKFCEHCGMCKKSCPTKILDGRSKSCLSEITQRKGELSENEVELMRKYNTVWGCDECQSHCPHNESPEITPIQFFRENRITKLTTEILSSMDNETFEKRAFAWRKRKTVERNLEKLGY